MQKKTYLVTNNSEGSICVTGRTRIDIPGKCKDLLLSLPENTARQTISRLKQRYPLLKITDATEVTPVNSAGARPPVESEKAQTQVSAENEPDDANKAAQKAKDDSETQPETAETATSSQKSGSKKK